MYLVTGGAGFIGSNFIHLMAKTSEQPILCLDALTYSGNAENLHSLAASGKCKIIPGNIQDEKLLARLFEQFKPQALFHFAAESHVDRSITGPRAFIDTNVVGTFTLLQESLKYWKTNSIANFRFIHISTDEVYGSLKTGEPAFSESTTFAPNSPYSASKAGADHLVRAYFHTYGLPTLTLNCSNNYGPRQFPEKLIPLILVNALAGKKLPIYGDGSNVRDWLFVDDFCRAIQLVGSKGVSGDRYNVGGDSEKTNLEVVKTVCLILDEFKPRADKKSYWTQAEFVTDRLGHDFRYAVNHSKITGELGWLPTESFDTGLRKTVRWYLDNSRWVERIMSGDYKNSNLDGVEA